MNKQWNETSERFQIKYPKVGLITIFLRDDIYKVQSCMFPWLYASNDSLTVAIDVLRIMIEDWVIETSRRFQIDPSAIRGRPMFYTLF